MGFGNEPLVVPCHGFVFCVDSDSVCMNNLQSLRHLYRHRLCNQGNMTVGHGDVGPDEGPDVVLLDGAPADHSR